MPPSSEPSNLRAYVHWNNSSVFAGEEIECIITFENIARSVTHEKDAKEKPALGASANGTLREKRRASLAQSAVAVPSRKASNAQNKPGLTRAPSSARDASHGHRPVLSLNVVGAIPRNGPQTASVVQSPASATRPAHGHGRSLSIVSLGGDSPADLRSPTTAGSGKRPAKGHLRSASLQHMPRLNMPQGSPSTGFQSPRQPSPLYESSIPPTLVTEPSGQPLPIRPARRRPGTMSAGNTPQLASRPGLAKQHSVDSYRSNFKFPATSVMDQSSTHGVEMPKPVRTPSTMHSSQTRHFSPRPPLDSWSTNASNLNPLSRVMSETSLDGTPRSSSEMYTISNHSDETLTSEAPPNLHTGRLMAKGTHSRRASRSPQQRPPEQETLMMAYAQISGHFVLDGSLVNAAPFEEVKRKGVQGGGGVVGVERAKRPSSMFGAFSWGNIGESLGGLLGSDDMSSIAQMKASAGTKEIPLLSTPQSLLFVNLSLAPGESKNFKYRFALPRGLPPTYRGKAIKVSYQLSLGVQRPEGQLVKQVEVPFRVLGSYDMHGEALGHDLMQPYVLLQDAAQTTSISADLSIQEPWTIFSNSKDTSNQRTPKQGLEDFLRYTERLFETTARDPSAALTSPTSPSLRTPLSRQGSLVDHSNLSVREAIDFAIIRSNFIPSPANNANQSPDRQQKQSANRFNIARSGQPVAMLTILRPAFRLGEAVTGVLDFTSSSQSSPSTPLHASTYSLLLELESIEEINASLSLRSAASVQRVTRKVHAAARENTLFARRVAFNLNVPASAAPSFETSGVRLNWRLRVEFTTQRQVISQQQQGLGIQSQTASGSGNGNDENPEATAGNEVGGGGREEREFMEVLANDERGTTVIAREQLVADSFEIAVPLRIYGAVGVEAFVAESEALVV